VTITIENFVIVRRGVQKEPHQCHEGRRERFWH
jgi:hypothetical protein